VGRADRVVNVGGLKVSLDEVETHAVSFGATLAKAYPASSVVTGSLVCLDYTGKVKKDELVQKFAGLPKHMRPARIRKVTALTLGDTGKVQP
jgi:acyl-coenzyme A synthetase/AMP-(fatty) acid ligase